MIEFSLPAISFTLNDYMELVELWESCGSCIGFCVSLGEKFFSAGIQEIDDDILPRISGQAGPGVVSRVLPSYSILYWYSTQVFSV